MRNSSGCAGWVDTTAYLHSRWVPLRMHAALRQERTSLRFVVVLRNPSERAVLHWRSLNAAMARVPAPTRKVRNGVPVLSRLTLELAAYVNGSTLARKARVEGEAMRRCLHARRELGTTETSVDDWMACTTLACSWFECVMGTGMYAPQLRNWLRYFEPKQLLLLDL